MRSKSYIARWKNFLNFLTQMFDTSSIVALAGNGGGMLRAGLETKTVSNYDKRY